MITHSCYSTERGEIKAGTYWRHRATGRVYQLLIFTNCATIDPIYPPMAIFKDQRNSNIWAKDPGSIYDDFEEVVKQIFTFGFGQGLDNCYVVIFAKTPERARDKMFSTYGGKFGFQYDSEEDAGVSRFNLKCVQVIS